LRCHTGHRDAQHGVPTAVPANPINTGIRANIDLNPNTRAALYTNCTNCHAQIHGSDVPSPGSPNPGILVR
jgi:hypothetical protein